MVGGKYRDKNPGGTAKTPIGGKLGWDARGRGVLDCTITLVFEIYGSECNYKNCGVLATIKYN